MLLRSPKVEYTDSVLPGFNFDEPETTSPIVRRPLSPTAESSLKLTLQKTLPKLQQIALFSEYRKWNTDKLIEYEPYQKGSLHGTVRHWYLDGIIKEERQYSNGKLHGSWISYHSNGNKRKERNYVNNKRTGYWAEWANNGVRIKEYTHLDGFLHDKKIKWYLNGNKKEEITFNRGVLNGSYTKWFPTGEMQLYIEYKGGKKHGVFMIWSVAPYVRKVNRYYHKDVLSGEYRE